MKFSMIAFPLASAWDGWSDCGSADDMATLNAVTVSPDPPVKGVPLTFTFDMSLKEQLVGGTIDLDLKAGDVVPIPIKETDDLCDTFKDIGSCPIAAGPLKFSFDETVPKLIPVKHVYGTINLVHSDSRKIACVKLDTNVGSEDGDLDSEFDDIKEMLAGNHSNDVLTGMFKGLVSDSGEFDDCEMQGLSAGAMFAAAAADFQAHKFVDVATDLSIAFGKVQPLVQDCQVVMNDVVNLAAALEHFSPKQAQENAKVHQTEILEERAAASQCKDDNDYVGYGQHLGAALRHVLVTDSAPTTAEPATTTMAPTTAPATTTYGSTTAPATTTVTMAPTTVPFNTTMAPATTTAAVVV